MHRADLSAGDHIAAAVILDGGGGSQILGQHAFIFRADELIQRVSAGDDDHAPRDHVGAVGRSQVAGLRADGLRLVHLAIGRRHGTLRPPVGHGAVALRIVGARVGGQLSADRAGGGLHQTVLAGIAVQNIPVAQALMNLLHVGLPQRGRRTGARVIIVTHPQGRGIIARHAGEEHALLVRVRARLARHGLAGNLRGGARAAGYRVLQHVHDHLL